MWHPLATDALTVKIEHRNEISVVYNHNDCFTTSNYDVNYLQLLVLGVNMHVYN